MVMGEKSQQERKQIFVNVVVGGKGLRRRGVHNSSPGSDGLPAPIRVLNKMTIPRDCFASHVFRR